VPSAVASLLGDLSVAFQTLNLRWYLFGAQAALVYGSARLTADVDVTVGAPANADAASWLPVLEQHGFAGRFGDAAFFAQTRVLPLVHQPTSLPTDVVLAGPGLEVDFLSRAVIRDVDGVAVPIMELADLLAVKVLAGRPKDVEDAISLVRIHRGAVNDRRVRAVLALLEGALGQSDLIPAFEEILRRAT
jgi:hypothetical protein